MDRWMDGHRYGWMDMWKDKCAHMMDMNGWVDGWMDGWMDRWVDGWMDG